MKKLKCPVPCYDCYSADKKCYKDSNGNPKDRGIMCKTKTFFYYPQRVEELSLLVNELIDEIESLKNQIQELKK